MYEEEEEAESDLSAFDTGSEAGQRTDPEYAELISGLGYDEPTNSTRHCLDTEADDAIDQKVEKAIAFLDGLSLKSKF